MTVDTSMPRTAISPRAAAQPPAIREAEFAGLMALQEAAAHGPEDRPRLIAPRTVEQNVAKAGAALSSLALTWIVYEKVLALSGVLGFVICWWAAYVALFALIASLTSPRPIVVDQVMSAIVVSGAMVVAIALATTVVFILLRGEKAMTHLNFYVDDMAGIRPTDPLGKGGIRHAMLGSAIQIGIASLISLPLGIGTAVYLTEVGGRATRVVRTVVEAMTALPDILAGLFIYTVLIIALHWDRTGFAVSLALAVTMVPIIARAAEVTLRVVPGGLREASLALGASRWQTVRRVVLPTVRSGLATTVILGIARIAGETAPLLIVSGSSTFTNVNPMHQPMNSLPLFIFTAVRSGQPLFIERGYGAAAVLLIGVLILFATARFLARDRAGARR